MIIAKRHLRVSHFKPIPSNAPVPIKIEEEAADTNHSQKSMLEPPIQPQPNKKTYPVDSANHHTNGGRIE